MYCKGGPGVVIKYCSQIINSDGEVIELTDELKDRLINEIEPDFAN